MKPPLHVVVMGVAGCGKSAVGTLLAARWACR
jgi:gluconate kinase